MPKRKKPSASKKGKVKKPESKRRNGVTVSAEFTLTPGEIKKAARKAVKKIRKTAKKLVP